MCFRPADVTAAPAHCPECGKRVNKTQGVYPKKCPFCKTSLEGIDMDALALEQAKAAGGGPAAPSVPGAPVPPKAPGAPVPPSAPKA